MKTTQYTCPTTVFTSIPATSFARRVEFSEDGSGALAGIKVKLNTGVIITVPVAQQPYILADKVADMRSGGNIQGIPAQTGAHPRVADTYLQIQPVGATTVVNVVEYD